MKAQGVKMASERSMWMVSEEITGDNLTAEEVSATEIWGRLAVVSPCIHTQPCGQGSNLA